MIIKVFDDDGKEIGQASNYSVRTGASPIVELYLKDWKTPTPEPIRAPHLNPTRESDELEGAKVMLAALVRMLGGAVIIHPYDMDYALSHLRLDMHFQNTDQTTTVKVEEIP